MKILMLTSGTPHSSITHRLVALGGELAKRGHEVTIIAPSMDRHSKWQLDQPDQIAGVRFVYPWQLHSKSFLVNLGPYMLGAAFAVLKRRADVIYISKPTPATIVGVLGKWFRHTPIVLDMDDLGSEVMRIEGHSALIWRLVAMCERIAARQAKAIVVVSRLLEREFLSRFWHKPILRLPNGVGKDEFSVPTPTQERQPRLVFFGLLGRVSILAPVLEALPDVIKQIGAESVQLEVLGDGPCRQALEVRADQLGVSEQVKFRGWMQFSELGKFVSSGDIALCIMPNERTTAACSNQKVFQYQAMELAVVATRVGDLPLYLDNGAAGVIVEAGDKGALVQTLVRLIREPEYRKELARRGHELASSQYSWQVLATQLEQFLEKVA